MPDRRRMLVGARAVAGGTALLVATVVAVVVAVVPVEPAGLTAPRTTVTPDPAPLVRVCPGSVLRFGDEAGQDAESAVAVGRSTVRSGAVGAAAEVPRVSTAPLADAVTDSSVLTADPADEALLVGAQAQVVRSDGLSGLAAATCREASGSSWLIGGATTTGRTTLISLSNPTEVQASVALRIWTETGAVSAPGLAGIEVPPGSQRILSLAGFVQDAVAPVVQVTSRGGQVVATLQQSTIRQLDPGGVDLVGEAAPPAVSTTIPGIRVVTGVPTAQLLSREGYQDLQTVIRLLAPGDAAATARVEITPEAGGEPLSLDVPLEPGLVAELPIEELPDGVYTARVEADQPVAAAVRAATAQPLAGVDPLEAPVSDFAWFSAVSPLTDRAAVIAPQGAEGTLHLANPDAEERTVVLATAGAEPRSLLVPASGSLSLAVPADPVLDLQGAEGLTASVSVVGAGRLASVPVVSPRPVSSPIVLRR